VVHAKLLGGGILGVCLCVFVDTLVWKVNKKGSICSVFVEGKEKECNGTDTGVEHDWHLKWCMRDEIMERTL
jgi:hypothetical protein